jgi:hypothetical protein
MMEISLETTEYVYIYVGRREERKDGRLERSRLSPRCE